MEKFQFDLDFQKKILKLMIDDPNVLMRAQQFCKPEYFANEFLEWVYNEIIAYYKEFQAIITRDVFIHNLNELFKKDGKLPSEQYTLVEAILKIEVKEKEFILKKLQEWLAMTTFATGSNMVREYYNTGKFAKAFELAEECINDTKKITFEAPDRSFFFEDVEQRRFKRNLIREKDDYRFTSGILQLDAYTNGGISRGELGIVAADAKKGKSILLTNIGATNVLVGAKVAHFALEGKDLQVDNRYEAKILNEDYYNVVKNNIPPSSFVNYQRYQNSLVICNMLNSFDYNIYHIEEELENLKAIGFVPDLVIVDYGDLLKPRHSSKDDKYSAQEEVFQDLKILATKHNIGVWTATQCHRVSKAVGNPDEDVNFLYTRHTLADSYAKVRVADLLITLNMTREEKANNRMRVYLDAYRDNVCQIVIPITTDYSRMQFYKPTGDDVSKYNSIIGRGQ